MKPRYSECLKCVPVLAIQMAKPGGYIGRRYVIAWPSRLRPMCDARGVRSARFLGYRECVLIGRMASDSGLLTLL